MWLTFGLLHNPIALWKLRCSQSCVALDNSAGSQDFHNEWGGGFLFTIKNQYDTMRAAFRVELSAAARHSGHGAVWFLAQQPRGGGKRISWY